MQGHKVLERTIEKAGYFHLEHLKVQHPKDNSKSKIYSIAHHSNWVNVIAETEDNNIVLVEQWRAGIDDMSLEVPGGKIDEGETPAEAGIRELQEETGYVTTSESRVVNLGRVFANPAIQGNSMHFIYVSNVEPKGETDMDEFELVYTHVYDRNKVLDMLLKGKIEHSYSVLGLYKAFKGW